MNAGLKNTLTITVEPNMTAKTMKSGALEVFATPIMIAFRENVCLDCVASSLAPGQSTVGTEVNIRHLSPTPVGMKVTFTCELMEVDRRRLVFSVQAEDEAGLIGEGTHERFIVDGEKFLAKCAAKAQSKG